jgi:hypothetical protein
VTRFVLQALSQRTQLPLALLGPLGFRATSRPPNPRLQGKLLDLPKLLEGEVLGPEEHTYNDQTLSPKQFLEAVYKNPRLPMSVRIDAAKGMLPYEYPRLQQVSQDVTSGARVIIEGGLPALPGTNIIMPGDEPTKPNGKAKPNGGSSP